MIAYINKRGQLQKFCVKSPKIETRFSCIMQLPRKIIAFHSGTRAPDGAAAQEPIQATELMSARINH